MHPNPLTRCLQTRYVLSVYFTTVICFALQDTASEMTPIPQHSASGQSTSTASSNSNTIQSTASQDTAFSQQLSDWTQRAPDSPVHAVSLLRFSPSSSSDSAGKDRKATVPDLAVEGGCGARRVLAARVVKQGGECDQGYWDAVSVSEYHSRAALRDALMVESRNKHFPDAAIFAVLSPGNAAAKL